MIDREQLYRDTDLRITDQRIGMGIGGWNVVIRLYHKPTRIVIELPAIGGARHTHTEIAFNALEFMLDSLLEKRMIDDKHEML